MPALPPRLLPLLALLLPTGCLGPVALTTATPVPEGKVELDMALSTPLRVQGDGSVLPAFQPEVGVRIPLAEPLDLGFRLGLPTGIMADFKVRLAGDERWALALLPGGGFTPFQLEEDAMFGWLDAPLLVDVRIPGEHFFTVGGRYRLIMFLGRGRSASPFAHGAGAELAFHINVDRDFWLAPHVSWLRTVEGRFLHGRDTVAIGLAARGWL